MSTIVRVQHKGQVTIPTRLRMLAGIAAGDLVEATFDGGKIILTPQQETDRSKLPNADEEYTPAQRRIIDARLDKGLADIKKGRTLGPFDTAGEIVASMKRELKKRAVTTKRKR